MKEILMSLVNWKPEFSVNVDQIDEEHKNILLLVNKLEVGISHGTDINLIYQVLIDLMEYAITHFTSEEMYMEQIEFPLLESHQMAHRQFSKQLKIFIARYKASDKNLGKEISSYMTHWWQRHILDMDQHYAQYAIRKGVGKVDSSLQGVVRG
jgi:hemerythrin